MSELCRLYVDSLILAAYASEVGDPTLNWLDVSALAVSLAGRGAGANIFLAIDSGDPESEQSILSYARVLRSSGVTVSIRETPASNEECHRCGHAWEYFPQHLLSVDLALTLIEDMIAGRVDVAYVLAGSGVFDRLAQTMTSASLASSIRRVSLVTGTGAGRRVPSNQRIGLAMLRSMRLARTIILDGGSVTSRPERWNPAPRVAGPQLVTHH